MADTKVIGGEYAIDATALHKNPNRSEKPVYSLGRTCFYAILDSLKDYVDEILLPDYICKSIAEVPHRLGIQVRHYHITMDFNPDIDSIQNGLREKNGKKAILLISYFGMVNLDETIRSIRSYYQDVRIIVDDVQNYYGYGQHLDFDFCFTSYRKWFAVPDGADVIAKDAMPELEVYDKSSEYALYKTAGNLLKNHKDMIGDSISLELIDKGERMMDKEYRYSCSGISGLLYERTDFASIAKRRVENACFLNDELERLNVDHLYSVNSVPLFIPILIKNRDQVRKMLFNENIFAPIHWPVEDIDMQGNNNLYKMELSLICDQRYDKEDMERIIRGLENAM